MNDSYVECMVPRKSSPFSGLIKVLVYALTAICVLLAVMGLPILFIPAIALGLVIYFLLPGLSVEYEYLYLDKEISIDKVLNKQKRKRVRVLDLNKMELLAPDTSHELDSYKSRRIKIQDYSSGNPENKKHIMVYNGGNGTELICLEPNAAMIKCIKTVSPRKIFEY
ncbi:MAG: hypothetical protein GX567_09625 [Clostridia bacterium]|nr:hypothetical protein [Clostridia bacterium]